MKPLDLKAAKTAYYAYTQANPPGTPTAPLFGTLPEDQQKQWHTVATAVILFFSSQLLQEAERRRTP